ncbi:MAG: 3D domain-containing protein [Defluviitaleaceae bacterium]|nr:3D domain-containing protein [Defluviitaleaceae bacterium]
MENNGSRKKFKVNFKKFNMVIAGALIALTVFLASADIFEGATFGVLVIDNGETSDIYTSAATVGDLLQELEIELHQFDRVSLASYTPLTRGTVIEIDRAIPVNISIDGAVATIAFYARPDAGLAALVSDFRRATRGNFIFDRELAHHRPEAGETIHLQSVNWETREVENLTPYNREYVETFALPVGETLVYREGMPGKRITTYNVEYVARRESRREVLSDVIISEPQAEIVHIGVPLPAGTGLSASGEVFNYSRMITVESTAYTLSVSCTGRTPDHPHWGRTASGMMAQVGIVAVDTNVIPFHTRMYIEGYGFAVAGDRGGAIRGYKIDVFMDTMAEARQWGRQHGVRVWILED